MDTHTLSQQDSALLATLNAKLDQLADELNKSAHDPSQPQKNWLNITEASIYTGLNYRTLKKALQRAHIRGHQVAGTTVVKYSLEELDKAITHK
ncbi:hypothetical protein [Weissella cibaria]|uniref:hypothetical protein n=1 Tax=Weissella cibaria TaxID=137591 RepID=UPI000705C498|nr:hypothetical protein [Weissella cibaria]ALI33922.1 hypothetical protein AO080_10930 [Weissella cibaria]